MKESNEEIKKKIESILFAAGKKIELVEIAKLCRLSHNLELVEATLNELKEKYKKEESPLMLVQEGTAWKLTVREKYADIVKKIVTQSELSKTIVETMAVIAYKAPVLQSEIIKIRTNKAYDHLKELESSGYITRKKKGRTKLIELSPKFFEYFDVPPEKMKAKFRTVEDLEKAVELKEAEASEAKQEFSEKKKMTKEEEEKFKEEAHKKMKNLDVDIINKEEKIPEIDLLDKEGHKKKLNVYNSEIAEGTDFEEPKSNIEVVKDKIGQLDVVEFGLTPREKKELIAESEKMKEQDLAAAGEKAEESVAKEAEKKREEQFEKKFDITGAAKEKPAKEEKAEEEEPEEEEAPEEAGAAEAPAEEAKPAEKKPEDILKPSSVKEKPSERVTAKGIAGEAAEHRATHKIEAKEGKRLFEKGVPKSVQEKIDDRVEEIVFGKKPEAADEDKDKEKSKEKEKTPEKY